MNHQTSPHHSTAPRGKLCVLARWIDSGMGCLSLVVDSNRPAAIAGGARGLLKQYAAAH